MLDINRFTNATHESGLFAGGDLSLWKPNVVISAIADGKRAAESIDRFLGGSGELNKGTLPEIQIIEDYEVSEPHPRFATRKLPVEERCDSFIEVECGYHKLDAMAEALRCLHCDRR